MSAKSAGHKVLVVDDDPDLRDIIRSVLESNGFSVSEASDGEIGLSAIRKDPPDLVLLDRNMPKMNGEDVCKSVKEDTLLRHVPIIMLTARSEVQDKVEGLNVGADDYVTKPFDPQELMARVQMVMRRSSQDLDANPLTHLPGNMSIQKELERRINSGNDLAAAYIDLDRFKAYNDHYGFKRGDDVIKCTASVLLESSKKSGTTHDFIGHIGGDDFIVITIVDAAKKLCDEIVKEFDAAVPALYDEADRKRKYIIHKDRKGKEIKVPMVTVSIALVTNEIQPLTHPGQIAEIGAELKAHAKQYDRSLYVTERRGTDS